MKNFLRFVVFCAVVMAIFIGMSGVVRAETRVQGGYLEVDTHWTKENSPYILEDYLTVPQGVTLQIDEGVVIGTIQGLEDPPAIDVNGGKLDIIGTKNSPVNIHGILGIKADNGNVYMNHVEMNTVGGVSLVNNSVGSISKSEISGAFTGIYVKESAVEVTDSKIENNTYGIQVQPAGGPFMSYGNGKSLGSVKSSGIDPQLGSWQYGTGGIGNALDLPAQAGESITGITIANSSIVNNSEVGIKNDDDNNPVQALGNWWGSLEGPVMNVLDKIADPKIITGSVEYDPWLDHEPIIVEVAECCSSILFIPGLEGSRLYRPEAGVPANGMTTTTNQLWEPNRNDDVRKLFLNSNGSSTDSSIYAGEPIGKALGFVGVYRKFMDFLDDLSRDGTINEWKAFGYDWRKPISEVVAGREKRATTTESLVETVENLASNSRTGKITLIAHSNGGLVAKYLVKTLGEMGKGGLIDNVISVAVPYLGTPEAILALLHGYNQSLGGGLIVKDSVSRELGMNMASAYSLLPSKEYFSKIFSPTIAFASTTIEGINSGQYPASINTADNQLAFITDSLNVRKDPAMSDTSLPIRGNVLLASMSDFIHNILDPFKWPATITRWGILGWNARTSQGITYDNKSVCVGIPFLGRKCVYKPTYDAVTTVMGDGTVVAPSAAYDSGNVISENLGEISDAEGKKISHVNILEASSTQRTIESIVKSGGAINSTSNSLPAGTTLGEPDYSKEKTFLAFTTHSPVELHVYDSQGRHVGVVNSLAGVEDDVITKIDEEIPHSDFYFTGDEDDHESHIYIPDDDGQQYSVVIKGLAVGSFSFDLKKIRAGKVLDSVEYNSLPVTPLMIATTTVLSDLRDGQITTTLASSTPLLKVDIDGDGSADIVAKQNVDGDPIAYLEALKKTVMTLIPNSDKSKDLVKYILKLEDDTKKGKIKQIVDSSQQLKKRIGNKKLVGISSADRELIVNLIDVFVRQFE